MFILMEVYNVRNNLVVKKVGSSWLFIVLLVLANFVHAAEQSGATRYVRFTDNTGTHSGILEGQSIRTK